MVDTSVIYPFLVAVISVAVISVAVIGVAIATALLIAEHRARGSRGSARRQPRSPGT